MRTSRICLFCGVMFLVNASAFAGGFKLEVEGGGVWFSRNDVRIPGDEGTRFDLINLTGRGADPYFRLHGTYVFNDRHALRLTMAPLEVDGTGKLNQDVLFMDELFAAGIATEGTFKFNTYRLTYRRMFRTGERWMWGAGAALLVRDAQITLEQGRKRQYRDDLGLVPLLHAHGTCRLSDRMSLVLDIEGSWAPVGRAIDAAVKARYELRPGWHLAAGYRTLEGGADNDDVYTFAWLHHVLLSLGYDF